jgi:hypothetical protein
LQSRNILVTAACQETKNFIKQAEGWIKAIAGRTRVKRQWFSVMAYAVVTNRIKTGNQEKAVAKP